MLHFVSDFVAHSPLDSSQLFVKLHCYLFATLESASLIALLLTRNITDPIVPIHDPVRHHIHIQTLFVLRVNDPQANTILHSANFDCE